MAPGEGKDQTFLLEELQYDLHPAISIGYYQKHLEQYERDREWVLLLNEYLKTKRENLHWQISQNERSFEIWNREKFLLKEEGKKVLKRCGLDVEKLNFYQTAEPLAYYSHTRKTPQNMLILENKDTFYSMRRHLLEGKKSILGVTIGTLIYGAGKGIFKSFQDFEFCVEPYMKEKEESDFLLWRSGLRGNWNLRETGWGVWTGMENSSFYPGLFVYVKKGRNRQETSGKQRSAK